MNRERFMGCPPRLEAAHYHTARRKRCCASQQKLIVNCRDGFIALEMIGPIQPADVLAAAPINTATAAVQGAVACFSTCRVSKP